MKLIAIFLYFRVSHKDALTNDLECIQDYIHISSSNNKKCRLLIPEIRLTKLRTCALQKLWKQGLRSLKKQKAFHQAAVRINCTPLQIIYHICMWSSGTSFSHIVQHVREISVSGHSVRIKQTNKQKLNSLLGRIGIG